MLSIIIPSYNRNNELDNLLDDLVEQTIKDFEVIVIDDCSDEQISINKNYPFAIEVIRNKKNLGASASRNIGVLNANYEWLLFLDDDDKFNFKKCEIIKEVILNHNDVNFIYHPATCHMVHENFKYQTNPQKNIDCINLNNMLLFNQIGGMPMLAVKKEIFNMVGGLSSEIKALEDYEFLLKLVQLKELKINFIDLPLTECFFYTKRTSVSKSVENTLSAIKFIKEKYVIDKVKSNNFSINKNNMLAYACVMNLSRQAAKYYWYNLFLTKEIKYLFLFLFSCISPSILIYLRKYKK